MDANEDFLIDLDPIRFPFRYGGEEFTVSFLRDPSNRKEWAELMGLQDRLNAAQEAAKNGDTSTIGPISKDLKRLMGWFVEKDDRERFKNLPLEFLQLASLMARYVSAVTAGIPTLP